MPARKRVQHMYAVWVETLDPDGSAGAEMLYHDTSERQAYLVFARAIVQYPHATAALLRRDSKTIVRTQIERFV